jgi:hypothetical protein
MGIGIERMPKLGPPVVKPQKQPVFVMQIVARRSPRAVVLVRAIALPLSVKRFDSFARVREHFRVLTIARCRRWDVTQRPLAVVIVLVWGKLAGFSDRNEKTADTPLSPTAPANKKTPSQPEVAAGFVRFI